MIKPGHIELRDKVIFGYHELEKPRKKDFWNVESHVFSKTRFDSLMKEYQASRREAEVSNAIEGWFHHAKVWFLHIYNDITELKYNQPCEAEVGNNKAKILTVNS